MNSEDVLPEAINTRLQFKRAVTEVSGCPACSYQHAKMAVHEGMRNEEMVKCSSGGDAYITPDEAARIMLSAGQRIIAGNRYGISCSAFQVSPDVAG